MQIDHRYWIRINLKFRSCLRKSLDPGARYDGSDTQKRLWGWIYHCTELVKKAAFCAHKAKGRLFCDSNVIRYAILGINS